MVPRVKSPDGNPFAIWRSILNLTNSQPDMSMGFDYAANEVQFEEQDFQARYKPTGYSGLVTQDAYDLAYGYADPYAVSTFNTLNQVLIGDDRKLLGAQSFALAAASAPTLTGHSTAGTIAVSSLYVGVAARTGSGYYYGSGNSQGASTQITGLSGTTNSVTATVTSVKGAVAYDWFYSASGSTWYYYTTTTVNAATISSTITQNNALPSATLCPDLSTQWKGSTGVPTYNASADNGSANANDYDGLLASLSGDYNGTGQWVQPGMGTPNPAINTSLDGAALTLTGGTITEIEADIFVPLVEPGEVLADRGHGEREAGAGDREPDPGFDLGDDLPSDGPLGPYEHHGRRPDRLHHQRPGGWRRGAHRGPRLAASGHHRGPDRPGSVPAGEHQQRVRVPGAAGHRAVRLRHFSCGWCGWWGAA